MRCLVLRIIAVVFSLVCMLDFVMTYDEESSEEYTIKLPVDVESAVHMLIILYEEAKGAYVDRVCRAITIEEQYGDGSDIH